MKKFIIILTVLLSNLANATANEVNRLDWHLKNVVTAVPVKTLNGLKKLMAAKQTEAAETYDYQVANITAWDHHNR